MYENLGNLHFILGLFSEDPTFLLKMDFFNVSKKTLVPKNPALNNLIFMYRLDRHSIFYNLDDIGPSDSEHYTQFSSIWN